MKPTSESLSAQESRYLSVAEGYCVPARVGGEQPEAKDQSQTKVNSIRPRHLASRRTGGICGENPPGVPCEAHGTSHVIRRDKSRSMRTDEGAGVLGVGMVGRPHGVSQDRCSAQGWSGRRQSPHSSLEASNDRGAKADREMNAQGPTVPQTPGAVPERATPPGDSDDPQEEYLRMSLGSCMVWTQRMLQALERGNEGRKWHTLIDKVYAPANLRSALCTVTQRKTSAGVDGRSAQSVADQAEAEVALIERLLREGKYEPQPVRRVWIDKPGSNEKRPLGIPTIRDRITQTALLYVIEPIFEYSFAEHSYGFRPKRSAKQATTRVEALLKEGRHWVVDADIKGYFDNIPHDKLIERVRDKIADTGVLGLIEKFLRQGVMESMNGWNPTEQGTPQGAVISPLLANIYLDPLDRLMVSQQREMVRYADDFVILCRSQAEAEEVLEQVRAWMSEAGLTLHPEKTRIVDATQRGGFEFLGWHFERGYRWPRDKSQKRLKASIRKHTKRHNGHSLKTIVTRVNRVVRGWGNYFRGGVRTVSPKIDGWIRGRLRSILRARDKRKGRGRGLDHNRYPNDYFTQKGLTSLYAVTHPESQVT